MVAAAAALGLLALTLPFVPGAGAALPGEPTVEVTVAPNEVTVNASEINPVDATFLVNITGNNIGPRSHTMWVNISFSTSTGWRVNPTTANLTLALPAMGSAEERVSVTVTVPPGVSANNASVFSASFVEENDLRFSQGQTGNATAQIRIRQIFSTGAIWVGGTSNASARQGQDANYSISVTNRGNADATYDAQLVNAAELRPSDVVLRTTTPSLVPQNGSAVVRFVMHANPAAIPGNYTLIVRVVATAAGANPPAGAFAELSGRLWVQSALPTQPPSNDTTQPPPPQNNTTNPATPPPTPPDLLQSFLESPLALGATGLIVASLLVTVLLVRRSSRRKKARVEAIRRQRANRAGVGAAGPPGAPPAGALPARPGGPAKARVAVRPVQRPAGSRPPEGAQPVPVRRQVPK